MARGNVAALMVITAVGCGGEDFTTDDTGSPSSASAASAGGASTSGADAGGGGAAPSGGAGAGGQPNGGAGGDDACGDSAVCVAEPPAGWTGPAILYAGPDAAPACSSAWASDVSGQFGAVAAPFSCGTCSCDAPSGVACSSIVVKGFASLSCSGTGTTISASPNSCVALGGYESVSATASMPTGGTCMSSGGAISPSEPQWEGQARVCTGPVAQLAKCEGGICAPKPEPSFEASACVYQEGEVACPDSYPVGVVVYRGALDTRACSACACNEPTGVTCTGSVTAYAGSTSCASGAGGVPSGGCKNATSVGPIKSVKVTSSSPQGGSCPASGGQASGTVVGDLPLTVCCVQR